MARKPRKRYQGRSDLQGLRISRSPGQNIMIHIPASREDTIVWVGVNRVQGATARLAFEAPEDVQIWREELLTNDLDEISKVHPDT